MATPAPLTIVGGVREALAVGRRGRRKRLCARVASPAWVPGPSTSPLEDAARILRKGEIRIRRAKAKTLRLTLPFVRARQPVRPAGKAGAGGCALSRLCLRWAMGVRSVGQFRFALKMPRAHSRLIEGVL